MLKLMKKRVKRKTRNGDTSTTIYTLERIPDRRSRDKNEPPEAAEPENKGWFRRELKEIRNTIIEASFNKAWHTTIYIAVYGFIQLYLPGMMVLVPWLPPVVFSAAAGYVAYITGALLLFYLRRFVVWAAGKRKRRSAGKRKQ